MKVLVAYATAAGSTEGVAQWIASTLKARGHEVIVRGMNGIPDVAGYDAYVLGSAVHNQAWLPSAADFLVRHRRELRGKPVWLFSVGLPGALRGPLRKWASLKEAGVLADLLDDVSPIEHRLFTGVVTPEALGRFGAWVFRLMGGRFGDFRDWPAIETWATDIADALAEIEAATL